MNTRFTIAAAAAALCTCIAFDSGAKALYVDATRPNNNGNGLKAKTAKKTIQAAINIAKPGDTILVYPGTYAPIKTGNKKITIKSVKGKARTTLKYKEFVLLDKKGGVAECGNGNASKVNGFTLVGNGYHSATSGGTFSSCSFTNIGGSNRMADPKHWETSGFMPTFKNGKFAACVFSGCRADTFGEHFVEACVFDRCRLEGSNEYSAGERGASVKSSQFRNCLLADNNKLTLASCVLVNDTIADNESLGIKSTKAYNTIFQGVAASQFKKAKKNTLKNCYKGANPKFVSKKYTTTEVTGDGYCDYMVWDDSLGAYRYYAYETKPADYRLAKGSPCIDKGKLTKAQKKLVGKKDLAGKKRIKGKAIDIGCYEY